jgi:hypothetical protein
MGFSFRRSVSVGPFRFNLSNGGVSTSVGAGGLRLGTGPRGAYVSLSAGGFNYRQSLGPVSPGPGRSDEPHEDRVPEPPEAGRLTEIASGSVVEMVDATTADLVASLNAGTRAWPWRALAAIALGMALLPVAMGLAVLPAVSAAGASAAVQLVGAAASVGCLVGGLALWWWHNIETSTVVMYDDQHGLEDRAARIVAGVEALASAGCIWHVAARGAVADKKYHAGAGHVVERSRVRISWSAPKKLKTNVPVGCLPAGDELLYFLPDVMLVFHQRQGTFGAIPYGQFDAKFDITRFVEADAVPKDSKVVDTTWERVNRDGGPDRRFKSNRQLPVCEYGVLHLQSASGLNELFHISACNLARSVAQALSTGASVGTPQIRRALGSPLPASTVDGESEAIKIARLVTGILKYVALGDRKIVDAERAIVVAAVRKACPGDAAVERLAPGLLDVTPAGEEQIENYLSALRDAGDPAKGIVLEALTELVVADGKVTPKEKERWDRVRNALG